MVEGLNSTVDTWYQSACVYYGPENEFPYCTPTYVPFYVADSISSNHWDLKSSNASGIFGFAPASPIYDIINVQKSLGNQITTYQNFSLSISNITDWSFAQANKTVAHHSSSYISFGMASY
jgi:hypothetical protein